MRKLTLSVMLLHTLFISGCGGSNQANLPPVDDSQKGRPGQTAPAQPGMSTTKKVVMLAGAAALYYMYEHHKNAAATATGADSQYYLSKNGRVYYRDKEHRAHWVTPPPGGISVPADEASKYKDYQGYENKAHGKDLTGVGSDPDEK